MICVTLGHTTVAEMIAEHRALAQRGARLVELRLDLLREKPDVRRLLHERPCAVIVTCRRPEDGGRFQGSEPDRRALLQQAIRADADYVDLEQDTAAAIPREGVTQRIVSYHNFQQTPANLEQIHGQLAAQDADVVKLATWAQRQSDQVRMLKLVAASKVPTTAFCMGELGVASRILAGKYGAPFTYAAASEGQAVAPGQLSFATLREMYHYESIRCDTEVYGVIGDPIAQSLSPRIHNAAFQALGLNKVYLPFRIPSGELGAFFEDARWLEIRGLSVTIPHKEAVITMLREADPSVKATNAANTMVLEECGWKGYNTDARAAVESLLDALQAQHGAHSLWGKGVLVLGAGGAARAAALGLKEQGARVTLSNRTAARAEALAVELGCPWVAWERRGEVVPEILVNCTSVGMWPKTEESPMEAAALRSSMMVFDTVYNPEWTRLLREAAHCGCPTVSGREMFVRQAAAQFRLFTGRDAPLELMRELLRPPP